MKTDNMDKVIDKVQKLLSLAGKNPNENEANAAMLKAQQLMLKHGIDASMIEDPDAPDITKDDVISEAATEYGRAIWWHRKLAKVIANNFKCKHYIDYVPKAKQNKDGGYVFGVDKNRMRIMFLGLKEDVSLAKVIFQFAKEAIDKGADRCYAKFYNEGKDTKGIKSDYTDGFIIGLESKFKEQVEKMQAECTAIALLDLHPVVKEKIKDMGFETVNLNQNTGKQGNAGALAMGIKEGKQFDGNPNKIKG